MIPPPDIAANPWPLATLSFPTDPRGDDYRLLWGRARATIAQHGVNRRGKMERFFAYADSYDFRPAHFVPEYTQEIDKFKGPVRKVKWSSNLSPSAIYSGYDEEGVPSGDPIRWELKAHWHTGISGLITNPPPILTGVLSGVQFIYEG